MVVSSRLGCLGSANAKHKSVCQLHGCLVLFCSIMLSCLSAQQGEGLGGRMGGRMLFEVPLVKVKSTGKINPDAY